MDVRSLAFRTDLELLARSGSGIEDRGTHLVVRTPDNPTYWWGNFLLLPGPPEPGEAVEVVAAFHAEFPTAEHVAIGVDGTATLDVDELVAAGLEAQPGVVLTARDLVAPAHQVDAELRPLADRDWTAWVDLEAASSDMPDPARNRRFLAARGRQFRTLVGDGQGTHWGAFVDGVPVATLGVYEAGSGLARYQSVTTHPDHRRRGLASALVHRAGTEALERDDIQRLVIAADHGGDAARVYRRVGLTGDEVHTTLQAVDHG